MAHELTFHEETATDAVFRCVYCNRIVGFNKLGIGEPAAEFVNDRWVHPQDPDQWMEPCNG